MAGGTAVCAVVADQGAVAEEEKVCVGVEQGAAGIASEAVQVPSIAGYQSALVTAEERGLQGAVGARGIAGWTLSERSIVRRWERGGGLPSSKAFPSSRIYVGACLLA